MKCRVDVNHSTDIITDILLVVETKLTHALYLGAIYLTISMSCNFILVYYISKGHIPHFTPSHLPAIDILY